METREKSSKFSAIWNEIGHCMAFGLNSTFLPNPNIDFDTFIEKQNNQPYPTNLKSGLDYAEMVFNPDPVKIDMNSIDFDNPLNGRVKIEFDVSRINSFKQFMISTEKKLKEIYDLHLKRLKEIGIKKKQKYDLDYDLILQTGDMKKKKMKNQQIAKKLFPKDFDFANDNANPESATRKVGQYHKSYKKLVEGGYKDININ